MDKPANDNVIPFKRSPELIRTEYDWTNCADMLNDVMGAVVRGEYHPKGIVVAMLDEEEGKSVVFRHDMTLTEIALFFSAYLDDMRANGADD